MGMDTKHFMIVLSFAVCVAACSRSPNGGVSSVTINLAKASQTKTIACEAAFAVGPDRTDTADDGSTWTWLKGKDGTLTHHCRKQPNGAISAWGEASPNQAATHRLTFHSGQSLARFAPIGR